MATNIYGNGTNSTAGANTIVHFYDRAGIDAANRVNIYTQWADRKTMPTKSGKTFKISRYEHMYDRKFGDADFAAKGYLTARTLADVQTDLTNASLAEGTTDGNKRSLTKVTYETTLARYGEMIDYTDEVELFSEDTMQARYRMELGELANQRMEDLVQLDMLSTATVIYAGTATADSEIGDDTGVSNGVDYRVSYDLIRKATRKLVRNRAKKNTKIVTGATKIGTTPIAQSYYAIIGANVKADLENLTRGAGAETEYVYVPAHKYAGASTLAEGEVGAMHEVRFIESEAAIVYAGAGAALGTNNTGLDNDGANINVYPILFPTEGSFATVGLKGKEKIKFHSKSPTDVDNGNRYGTAGFFSYNFFYGGIILREESLLKVQVAASV